MSNEYLIALAVLGCILLVAYDTWMQLRERPWRVDRRDEPVDLTDAIRERRQR